MCICIIGEVYTRAYRAELDKKCTFYCALSRAVYFSVKQFIQDLSLLKAFQSPTKLAERKGKTTLSSVIE